MGGPVYHYDADNPSTTKFPAYWDSKAFFAEFSQDYLAAFDVQWPNGPVDHITTSCPTPRSRPTAQPITDSPIDIEFGPDGSLYVLDYGDGFFRANPDAGLYRIDYSPGNKAPTARITAEPDLEQRRAADRGVRRLGLERPRGRCAHLRVGLHR